MTFTKEQLSEWADKLIEETHSDISISRTDAHAESYRAQLALLEIALAALTAPQLPQPAVVPDEIPRLPDGKKFKYVMNGIRFSSNYANGWNACHAAMLQGGKS